MQKEKIISYILLFVGLLDLGIMFLQTAYIQSSIEAFVLCIGPITLLIVSGKMYPYEGKKNIKNNNCVSCE